MFRSLGHRDVPLAHNTADSLNIGPYANGLRSFVEGCETPMTIGLQGEWGSGKTSLMKLVQAGLDESDGHAVQTFWFETWQYGAMGDAETLGMHLMQDLTRQLMAKLADDDRGYKVKQKMTAAMKAAFPALLGAATSAALRSSQAGAAVTAGLDALGSSGGRSDMRTCFGELVTQAVGEREGARLVVFIDDLDRVRPPLAVRLLEVLKNFMDVQQCVFVVACDYSVVREGVQELMGIGRGGDRRAKQKVDAFFHKLFQVQFLMPVGSYKIDKLFLRYLETRLREKNPDVLRTIGVKQTVAKGNKKLLDTFIRTGFLDPSNRGAAHQGVRLDGWQDRLNDIVRTAVGTNPRAFKRFLNLVDLTSCVDDSSVETLGFWGVHDPTACVRTVRWCTGLFPIVALQQRWPEIAPYLLDGVAAKSRASSGGADATYTDFERRLRTLSRRWPSTDSDEIGTDFEDELVAELVDEHYRHEGHDTPALTELREFASQWFDLLNNTSDDQHLTPSELAVIAGWSSRLGKMGTTNVRLSGLAKLRATCVKLDAAAGDGFVAMASFAVNQARRTDDGLDHLLAWVDDDKVRLWFQKPGGGRRQLLKFEPYNEHLMMRVYGTPKAEAGGQLVGLAAAGARLYEGLLGLGFAVYPGKPSYFNVDFAPWHSADRSRAAKAVLTEFLESVESLVLAGIAADTVVHVPVGVATDGGGDVEGGALSEAGAAPALPEVGLGNSI